MNHMTLKRIERLEDRIDELRKVITKRNQQFAALKNRLYDVNLMFYLFNEFRLLDVAWFTDKVYIPDFFILLYAYDKDNFRAEEIDAVIENIPERLKIRRWAASTCLERLRVSKLLGRYSVRRGEHAWFITSEGSWFLMERTRDIRRIVLNCLNMTSKPRRRIIRGRRKI